MKKIGNIFWGLFFILAGLLIIVNRMGYLSEIGLVELIFLIVSAAVLISSLSHFNWFGVLLPLAIAAIVFAEPLGIEALTPWPVIIAAIFASIGLSIIFNKHKIWGVYNGSCHEENFAETIDVPDEEIVRCSVSLSSSIKYVNSKNFKRGDFECSLGAMKVYFDDTKLDKDGAVINLKVSLGGVELYIPREWNVVNNCNCSLGGIEEKQARRTVEKDAPTLTIVGNVSLGGVEIIYI